MDHGNDWRMNIGCGDVPRVPEDVEPKPEGCTAGGYGHGPDARDWYQNRSQRVNVNNVMDQ